jgi:hypothetical protein
MWWYTSIIPGLGGRGRRIMSSRLALSLKRPDPPPKKKQKEKKERTVSVLVRRETFKNQQYYLKV